MAQRYDQDKYNSQFAQDMADMKLRLQLMTDAVNTLDTAVRGTFDLLIDKGVLPAQAAGVKEYHQAMVQLRKLGLPGVRPTSTAQVQCPECRSMLRVKGAAGDRCEWCGYEF